MLFLVAAGPRLLDAQPNPASERPSITPGEILVLGIPPGRNATAPYSVSDPGTVEDRLRSRGVRAGRARPLSPGRNASAAFPGGAWVVSLESGADPRAEALRLRADPSVAYAGPNHLYPLENLPGIASDDSLFSKQWALTAARVPEAWETTVGTGIVVGVVDTGVDALHPDLASQLAVNVAEQGGLPGVDDDGNGFVDDVLGYDFTDVPGFPGTGDYLDRDPDPADEYNHGTRVTGVIVAARDNGIGIAGVAPGARVLPIRAAFTTTIPGIPALLQEDDIAVAILYAADRGVDILNFSFGDVVDSPVIAHSVRYAQSQGVLVVAAAGNGGSDHPHYPASLPGVLSVGASNIRGDRAGFSTYGQDLDLLAPGENLITTNPGGDYRGATGSSFSSPMAAGVAALVWSKFPELTADEVAWRIRLSSSGDTEGWTPDFGWGFLDAAAAVEEAPRPPVVQIEALNRIAGGWEIQGTVAHPDLAEWSISAVPESAVVGIEGPVYENDRLLVPEDRYQKVQEPLGTWTTRPQESGIWVVRLSARVRGFPVIEERTRLLVQEPPAEIVNMRFELQVGDRGWDVVGSWSSENLNLGALRTSGQTDHFASELSSGVDHGVRIPGPLPVGPARIEALARTDDQSPYTVLAETLLVVPDAFHRLNALPGTALPPGIPMRHTVDWDGDTNPEVLVEAPAGNLIYGEIYRYEVQGDGSVIELGSSANLYRGIPVDAADADGDGYPELVVFNLDRWMVLEADSIHAFPRRFVRNGIADSVPLGFVDTGSGRVLLAVAGPVLQLLDPMAAYAKISEAEAEDDLTTGFAAGDFDGDGITEVVVADQSGALVLFEVTLQGVSIQESIPGSADLAYSMLALPSAGAPADLFTAELDPRVPSKGGDFDRASVKIRRWRWNGSTLFPIASLALAGMYQKDQVQLLQRDGDLLVRTRGRVDLVNLDVQDLSWGGEVLRASGVRVDGAVLVRSPTLDRVWLGGSSEVDGESFSLSAASSPGVPSTLRVSEVAPVTNGLWVRLRWDSDACAPGDSLLRFGNVRGTYPLVLFGRTAADTIALDEEVTYTLHADPCPPRTLALHGSAPVVPLPVWENAEELSLNLEVPLEDSPSGTPSVPGAVWLADENGVFPPRAVNVHKSGGRILVRVPAAMTPDSLVLVKAWHADGYPVGGSERSAFPLSGRPEPNRPPVLAEVLYRNRSGGPVLEVELGGDLGACTPEFRLHPEELSLSVMAMPVPGEDLLLSLPRPLVVGEYTLELVGDCVSGSANPLGTERVFRVGTRIYPNPVRHGELLTLENLEPGSRVEIHDVTGNERLSFRALGVLDRRSLEDLGPGLYFLRLEAPDGTLLGIHKLAVLR